MACSGASRSAGFCAEHTIAKGVLTGFSDTDFVGDVDARKSIIGVIGYLLGE
jgi:hypothetical protein